MNKKTVNWNNKDMVFTEHHIYEPDKPRRTRWRHTGRHVVFELSNVGTSQCSIISVVYGVAGTVYTFDDSTCPYIKKLSDWSKNQKKPTLSITVPLQKKCTICLVVGQCLQMTPPVCPKCCVAWSTVGSLSLGSMFGKWQEVVSTVMRMSDKEPHSTMVPLHSLVPYLGDLWSELPELKGLAYEMLAKLPGVYYWHRKDILNEIKLAYIRTIMKV